MVKLANQFLDMRLSVHSNTSGGDTELTNTPLLIGDIGVQTAGAASMNVSNVRVLLTGTVSVIKFYDPDIIIVTEEAILTSFITISIERGGTGTAGTGTVIWEEVVDVSLLQLTIAPLSVNAGDFPPAAAVMAGQIRYTMFIRVDNPFYSYRFELSGPAVLNGIAAAGTT
ncbi:hypothetical protein [Paenibacillus sp. OV219]|uniref:hypothetical protein n=1 Tax=Paenibacillus sp. OV219 TaxID=1884377 RepID=UPI0008C931E1|nr:hypothetical protein [Paenibacillus sp. OV219]SEO55868.1 hypothetical protein SAMN05518847_108248 [Paenibacillus sp. OV219]